MITKKDIEKRRADLAKTREENRKFEEILKENARILQNTDYRAAERRFEAGEISPEKWATMKEQYDALRVWVDESDSLIAGGRQFEEHILADIKRMEREYKQEHPVLHFLDKLPGLLFVGFCVWFLCYIALGLISRFLS